MDIFVVIAYSVEFCFTPSFFCPPFRLWYHPTKQVRRTGILLRTAGPQGEHRPGMAGTPAICPPVWTIRIFFLDR